MPERFDIDEFKQIDEYKKFEAENYSGSKEIFDTFEFKNNFEEQSNNPVNNETNALNNDFKDNFNNNSNNSFDSQTQIDSTGAEVSKITTTSTTATGSSITASTTASTVTAVSTVGGAAVGVVGAVVICSNFLAPTPTMEIISINTGADYVYYDVVVSDLDEEINYSLLIENAYGSFIFEVSEGKNEKLVSGLKPYCEYSISLVSDNKDLGGYRTYYKESFYTKKPDNPEAILTYNAIPNYETYSLDLSYDIFISDYYKQGSDYYYTISYNEDIIFSDEVINDDYHFEGELTDISEGEYTFDYYCVLYDELISIGSDVITLTAPSDLVPPVVDYEINNVTIEGTIEDGYSLDISLSGYNNFATYKLDIVSNEFNNTYYFEANNLVINDLFIDYENTKLKLTIIYNNEEIVYEYELKDFIDVDLTILSSEFDEEKFLSIINYDIIGQNIPNSVYCVATNNYNEEKEYTALDNKFEIDMCGDVTLNIFAVYDDFTLSFVKEVSLATKLNVAKIEYGNYDNQKLLAIKVDKYLPIDSQIFVSFDGLLVEESANLTYLEDGYYIYDGSLLSPGSKINVYATYNGEAMPGMSYEAVFEEITTIPTYTKNFPNPGDAMITFNDDSTYNAYIPVYLESDVDSIWYRIKLNDNLSITSKDPIAVIKNLDPSTFYNLQYSFYYDYNGISYYLEGELPSGGLSGEINTSELRAIVDSDTNQFTISGFFSSYNSNVLVTYTDGTSENVTLDEYAMASYDGSKCISTIKIDLGINNEMLFDINDLNIELVGNTYISHVIDVAPPYELNIESISYGSEYDDTLDTTNDYLYIHAPEAYALNYKMYILQNDNQIYSEYSAEREGYYVFDATQITKDTDFEIILKDYEHFDRVLLASKPIYNLLSDTSTLEAPAYSFSSANPGDVMITFNDDSTFNAYIPVNFEANDTSVWYRILVGDDIFVDSRDYIAQAYNLDSSQSYSLKYEVYYDYNGISYLIKKEWPSGGISGTLDTSSTRALVDSDASTFKIEGYHDYCNPEVLVTYTDGSSETTTIASYVGSYDNTKIIKTITLNIGINSDLDIGNIEIVGNRYQEFVIDVAPPYELNIESITYGSEYDDTLDTTNDYLYIHAPEAYALNYKMYILQNDNQIYSEYSAEREGYYVFDATQITKDTDFEIILKDYEHFDRVLLASKPIYNLLSDTSTLEAPAYSFSSANPGDVMITFNDDSTFNAYIPVNFEANDTSVWYRILVGDDIFVDSRDYIAQAYNLDSSQSYSLKYEVYYEYNGISYLVTSEWPSGSITGEIDSSRVSAVYDPTTSTFTISGFYENTDYNVLVTYSDGSSETVTIDSSYIGSYDSLKTIQSLTINYNTGYVVDDALLEQHSISKVGNNYTQLNITNISSVEG